MGFLARRLPRAFSPYTTHHEQPLKFVALLYLVGVGPLWTNFLNFIRSLDCDNSLALETSTVDFKTFDIFVELVSLLNKLLIVIVCNVSTSLEPRNLVHKFLKNGAWWECWSWNILWGRKKRNSCFCNSYNKFGMSFSKVSSLLQNLCSKIIQTFSCKVNCTCKIIFQVWQLYALCVVFFI